MRLAVQPREGGALRRRQVQRAAVPRQERDVGRAEPQLRPEGEPAGREHARDRAVDHLVRPAVAPERVAPGGADQVAGQPQLADQRQEAAVHGAEQLRAGVDPHPSIRSVHARPPTCSLLLQQRDARARALEAVGRAQPRDPPAHDADPFRVPHALPRLQAARRTPSRTRNGPADRAVGRSADPMFPAERSRRTTPPGPSPQAAGRTAFRFQRPNGRDGRGRTLPAPDEGHGTRRPRAWAPLCTTIPTASAAPGGE
jgi:hypothetical protein